MQGNRATNTLPELILRRALHSRGIRYRVHAPEVPGKPDVVIRKYRLAVFVDGDFWHDNRWRVRGLPRLEDDFKTNRDFWVAKIRRNMERDQDVTARLREAGWTVVRLWESDIKADPHAAASTVVEALREAKARLHSKGGSGR